MNDGHTIPADPIPRTITIGTVPVVPVSTEDSRLALLLWGDAGCGKTTLASTAPGERLLVQFDNDGHQSVANAEGLHLFDLSSQRPNYVLEKVRGADPLGLGKFLTDNPNIQTVIIDSMTSYAYVALQEAVTHYQGRKSTMEEPGMHGYTRRNASVTRLAAGLLNTTGALKRNIIFITHEGTPDKNDAGQTVSVTMALSEGPANQLGIRLNEVWWMQDTGTERRIAVRPARLRKPMKTRMFDAKAPEFVWRYNPTTREGDTLDKWFNAWKAGGGTKIALPK